MIPDILMETELSIIIVSFNTKKLLKQTLNSLPQKMEWETIVVDNASVDGSWELVEREFPNVRLLRNSKNLGFAKANNQGIRIAKGEYLLLLNSDTIVQDGALERLVAFIDTHPEVGIASGQLRNPDGSIQPQGGHLPSLGNIACWMLFLDDLPLVGRYCRPYHINDRRAFTQELWIGWVGGTAMLIRRAVVDQVGLLNEEIFMYAEDVEYCLRAQQAGYQVAITPKARIVHLGQQSSGGAHAAAWIGEYKGILYIVKTHKPAWQAPAVRILLKTGALLRMLVFGILGGRKDAYAAYRKAFAVA